MLLYVRTLWQIRMKNQIINRIGYLIIQENFGGSLHLFNSPCMVGAVNQNSLCVIKNGTEGSEVL